MHTVGMATDTRIGTAIKRARERRRWTQRQLADALGVNTKSVDNWENGRTSPRSSIGALEEVLGISLDAAPPEAPPVDDWEAQVLAWEAQTAADPDIPDRIKRQMLADSHAAREAYAARRSRREAEGRAS